MARNARWKYTALIAAGLLLAGGLGVRTLDARVASGFRESVQSSPSRLLSRPFVLHEGLDPFEDGVAEPGDWWYPSPWYVPEKGKISAVPREGRVSA